MSIDKKKIGKILKVTAIGTGVTFLGLNMIAKKKKGDSVFEKEKDQKNPFAGKKVVFVEDESDEENADGVRGHLEAVGETKKSKGIYDRYIKRAIDVSIAEVQSAHRITFSSNPNAFHCFQMQDTSLYSHRQISYILSMFPISNLMFPVRHPENKSAHIFQTALQCLLRFFRIRLLLR